VEVYVHRLRKRLKEANASIHIHTIRDRGGCVQILSHILSGGSSGQAVCNSTVCLLSRSMFM
jgi:hypothetical protein